MKELLILLSATLHSFAGILRRKDNVGTPVVGDYLP